MLKALLLLRQSLGIRESLGPVAAKLRFTGSQVDLGNYRSFVSHNQTGRDCAIGITVDGAMPALLLNQLRTLMGNPAAQSPRPEPEYETFELGCEFRFGSAREYQFAIDRPPEKSSEEIEEQVSSDHEAILKHATFKIIANSESLLSWEILFLTLSQKGSPLYTVRIPKEYLLKFGGLESIDLGETDTGFLELGTYVRGMLPDRIIGNVKPGSVGPEGTELARRAWPLPVHMEHATRALRTALIDVNYLGPLRAPAKRYYTLQTDLGLALDPAGEFLPYILRDRSETPVWNLRIGPEQRAFRQSLTEALDYWLHYLRTGSAAMENANAWGCHELSIKTFQDVLVQIAVRGVRGNESHSLSDSGFGYSQVLPILARGLLMDLGDTLIVEEPEAHLNPALQVRMAHFLGSMARIGKQILVETHSEHIVNALRVLSAEDNTGLMADICRIFYIDVSPEKPIVRKLSISPDGTVPDWPRSFFGEAATLAGRLLRAQTGPGRAKD